MTNKLVSFSSDRQRQIEEKNQLYKRILINKVEYKHNYLERWKEVLFEIRNNRFG